jgi:hypothetical protein
MCFILHRVYIRSALGHVGSDELSHHMVAVLPQIVTLELLECVFCLDVLPNTRGAALKPLCKFSFSFLFHSNYVTCL